MKTILLSALLALVSCSSVKTPEADRTISAAPTPFILVIGDSNLVGPFGDVLHRQIASWKDSDVMSISIGGGNPSYYLSKMSNKCCGYNVRYSARGQAPSSLASGGKKNGAPILPNYSQDVFNVIKTKRPNLIVIALGSNADSQANYNSLISKINVINYKIPVYWVGPPNDKAINANRADDRIQNALDQYPRSPYHFYSSQRVATKLHPGQTDATRWVNGFIHHLRTIPRYNNK